MKHRLLILLVSSGNIYSNYAKEFILRQNDFATFSGS